MTHDEALSKIRAEVQTLAPRAQQMQLETMTFGQFPDEQSKAHGAAAQCVANAAAGLLKRAYKQVGLTPLAGPFDEPTSSGQDEAVVPSDVSAAGVRAAEFNYILALEAYNYAQEQCEKIQAPESMNVDNASERQAALAAQHSALEVQADLLASRVQALSDQKHVGVEVANALIESARYLLKGSREDLQVALGQMPDMSQDVEDTMKEDPETALMRKQLPELCAGIEEYAKALVQDMAGAMLGLGSPGTSVGCLVAGEKEAQLCASALEITERELAAAENPTA